MDDVFIDTLVQEISDLRTRASFNFRMADRASGGLLDTSLDATSGKRRSVGRHLEEPQWEALKFISGDVDNEDKTSSDDGNMDEDTSTSAPTEISISDFLDDTSSNS
ncbi:hypothetical protein Salat_0657600 [Sesamum alatum]|uniref:Uncharacterized protein n=1 Tax=Sesamum alatum TaxID=300844 RepID=A0AAE2CUD0_9LAMI|nr:hypothetical protein Salat_0657600 [Sesamum alatum]